MWAMQSHGYHNRTTLKNIVIYFAQSNRIELSADCARLGEIQARLNFSGPVPWEVNYNCCKSGCFFKKKHPLWTSVTGYALTILWLTSPPKSAVFYGISSRPAEVRGRSKWCVNVWTQLLAGFNWFLPSRQRFWLAVSTDWLILRSESKFCHACRRSNVCRPHAALPAYSCNPCSPLEMTFHTLWMILKSKQIVCACCISYKGPLALCYEAQWSLYVYVTCILLYELFFPDPRRARAQPNPKTRFF